MGKRTSAAAAAKLTQAEAKVALAARRACTAAARATHAARVAKATAAAATLAARVYVPTKARPYVAPVDISATRNVVRLARAASLQAVKAMRAIRMADAHIAAIKARAAAKATAVVKATMVAIDNGVAAIDNGVMVAPAATVVAPAPVNVHEVVAFLAMTPCLCALWFYATFDIAARAADKEAAKAANRAHARIRAPRVPMNTPEKRASITMACNAVRAAVHAAQAKTGTSISNTKVQARLAQGAAQRATNEARKEARMVETKPSKVSPIKAYMVHTDTPILGKLVGTHALAAHHKSTHVVHATSGSVVADARNEFRTFARVKEANRKELAVEAAKKAAMKQKWIELRKEKIARMCAKAWMDKGIWVDHALADACNDSDYATRESAYTELLALVGVAA